MKVNLLRVFVVLLLTTMAGSDALAQVARPSNSLYLRPGFGFANYMGDNNKYALDLGVNGMVEVGYHLSRRLSVGALYSYADYTAALRPVPSTGFARASAGTRLSHAQALLRYTLGKETATVAPFIHLGGGAAFGSGHPQDDVGYGPMLGLGFDVLITRNTSFFIEWNSQGSTPDIAVDGPDRMRFGSFDLLNRLNIGLKFSRSQGGNVVEIFDIDTPTTLEVGEMGAFVADVNLTDVPGMVTYSWDYGDGSTSPLLNASHSYSQPGTYTVEFVISNGESEDRMTRIVEVRPRPIPAEIITVSGTPLNPDTRTPVQFDARVRGDGPLRYLWSFSDGSTAETQTATHIFSTPGNFLVKLRVENSLGADEQTLRVVVAPFEADFCSEVAEMNSVYFARNSSQLSQQAMQQLQENVEILLECPNLSIRIEGYAVPGERNPESLAEDRARAVESYYTQRSITESRVLSQGQGVLPGVGKLKDGNDQFRRSDTIIIR